MNYKKAMAAILIAIIVLSSILVVFILKQYVFDSIKTKNDYTWAEFEAMTPEEQMEFQNSFKNDKAFEKWMEEAQEVKIYIPWEGSGKAPSEYTWEEFEALTAEQQIAFQKSFESEEDFENWMEKAQQAETEIPWENGGKIPSDYTWEEFEALTPELQRVFQQSFEKEEDFENWMENAKQTKTDNPWENGGKVPSEYTWEEFENLTPEQQMEFQNSFESIEKFDEWLNRVNPTQEETKEEPSVDWEKDLMDYTWEEFEAMSMEEQMIFQNSFGSIEEFDKWLQANEPK